MLFAITKYGAGSIKPLTGPFHLIKLSQHLKIGRSSSHVPRINKRMDKVYFRNPPETNEMHITFRFTDKNLKFDRTFNLCRKLDEDIDLAVARIKNNLEKLLNNKNKKKKNEANTDHVALDPHVEFSSGKSGPFGKITFNSLINKFQDEDIYLNVINQTFKCVLNQPTVINVGVPPVLLTGCFAYPSKLELQYADVNHCEGRWYRTKESPTSNLERKEIWEMCGDGFLYNIKDEDLGCFLKFEITPGNEKGEAGPQVEKISKGIVQEAPKTYPFEKRHNYTKKKLQGSSLRIISYNLLADLYSDSEYAQNNLFPYCPKHALNSEYRTQLILKELIGYNGDIICLQEVDTKIFNYVLLPVLGREQFKYAGIMAEKGSSSEGVSTFYRKDRFELLECRNQNIGSGICSLPIFQPIMEIINQNKKLVERVADRATTLQLILLRLYDTNQLIIVANTHLYFHPDADHIRLLQIGFCMMYIETYFKETLAKYHLTNQQKLGIIFCGDFNSVPECGIYKLMTEGYVDNDFVDWSSNEEEAVKGVSLRQPFNIASACGTPEFTNITPSFAACLDYIFYQNDRFSVEQIIPLPSNDDLRENIALPSIVFPSDHVALIADLKCLHE